MKGYLITFVRLLLGIDAEENSGHLSSVSLLYGHMICQCQKLTFLASSNYLVPGIKGCSKTNIPNSKHWWRSYWPLSD